jgi:hypothetical protein
MEAFVRVLKNEIVPVFIFDGKPPKNELIKQRRKNKKMAEKYKKKASC